MSLSWRSSLVSPRVTDCGAEGGSLCILRRSSGPARCQEGAAHPGQDMPALDLQIRRCRIGQVSAIQRSMGADNHRLDSSAGRILDKLLGVEPVVNTGSSTPLKPRPTIMFGTRVQKQFFAFCVGQPPT
jgi:hypothetical protein